MVVGSGYTIKALDESNWDAFAGLVEATTVWVGASSARRTRCRRSRTGLPTRRASRPCRTGGSPATSSARGSGARAFAAAALAGALELIARLGGGNVEGYPEDAGSVPAGFLFNGALSTYAKLGFVRDGKIGKHRWGRHQSRRTNVVGDLATFGGHSGTLAQAIVLFGSRGHETGHWGFDQLPTAGSGRNSRTS